MRRFLFLLSGAVIWLHVLLRLAPAAESVALKSGESVDLSNLFWVANCHSLLKGPMKLDVLEGPPEITAFIREQDVVPHAYNCPAAVKGGVLVLTAAAGVQKKVQAKVVLRVKYPTVDGEKQRSFDIEAIVIP